MPSATPHRFAHKAVKDINLKLAKMKRSKNICFPRKDLQGLGLPYGDDRYTNPRAKRQRWAYRWLNEDTDQEQFQIKVNSVWYNAESIDFDFNN